MQTSEGPSSADAQLILVIEDEPAIANAMSLTLRGAGFVTCELTGASGVVAALDRNPFAVILDVALQQSDGVEVLRLLAGAGFTGVVQLVSGNRPRLLDDVKRVGERHGLTMLPALRKPFRMRDLRAVMLAESELRGQDETAAAVAEKADLRQISLSEALDRDWVEVWYQPKFDLNTGMLVGAECLARARHPSFGILSPGSFLHGADVDTLERLTTRVVEIACRDWARFHAVGNPLRLAVNITAHQLSTVALADLVRRCVPRSPDWPGLILEVTEEDVLRDVDAAHEIATQLAIHGALLSIDDFGLGYSSLARLSEIPFREVKLDRTLVEGCATDKTRGALCRAVVELSHTVEAKVVAEGIERREDLTYLRNLGCDLAQGFLLARPMPVDQLVLTLREQPLVFDADMTRTPPGCAPSPVSRTAFGIMNDRSVAGPGLSLDVSI